MNDNKSTDARCPSCGETLSEESGDDEVYCTGDGRDYHEACFEAVGFKCGVCQEHFLDEDLHHLAVVRPVDGVQRGVYRIVRFPFYADGLIEAFLYRDTLRRDGHLIGTEPREYPVCLLCPSCAAKRGVQGKT